MKNVMNIDTPFFRAMGKIGDIFLLNVIFVITSLQIRHTYDRNHYDS